MVRVKNWAIVSKTGLSTISMLLSRLHLFHKHLIHQVVIMATNYAVFNKFECKITCEFFCKLAYKNSYGSFKSIDRVNFNPFTRQKRIFWTFWRFLAWKWSKLARIYSKRHLQHESMPFFPQPSWFVYEIFARAWETSAIRLSFL